VSFERLAELERERACFAVATVVARRAPVSSHLGDRALVFADGAMDGFIGGSCSRDVVRREALRAIRSGQPRLVQIRPDPGAHAAARREAAGDECIVVAMGCASEGAVDVYIEPHLPRPLLIVAGDTPVAGALARVAAQIRYDVVQVVLEAELGNVPPIAGVRRIPLEALERHLADAGTDACTQLVAVVASQGHYDEAALAPLLAVQPAFVGLLASRRRAASVFAVLEQQGVAPDRLATVHAPVGLDIGARTPGDVAISILAQIVAATPLRAAAPEMLAADAPHDEAAATAVDPVCGMDVDVASAQHRLERDGRTYVFCCAGCRATFAANPDAALPAGGSG
jgi:xanthine dehydrogenase accessory factor